METSFAYEAKEFWRIARWQIRMSKPFEHWCLDTREVSGLELPAQVAGRWNEMKKNIYIYYLL